MGCGMAILATARTVAAGPGIGKDADRPMPLPPASYIDDGMASPRALSPHHAPIEDAEHHASAGGATENIPRTDRHLAVPVALCAVSSPGQRADGQWDRCSCGPGACSGRAFTMGDLAEDGGRRRGARNQTGSSEEVTPCPPTPGGTNVAPRLCAGGGIAAVPADGFVRRRRPDAGRPGGSTNVFLRSGPSRRLGPSQSTPTREGGAATDLPSAAWPCDREVADVTIHGTDDSVWWVGPHEEVAVCPRVTKAGHTPNRTGRNALSLDEDDLSDSGVYGWIGPGVFCREIRDAAVPLIDTRHNPRGSCWLFGGGYLGGRSAHPKAPVYAQRGGHATDEDTAY